VTAFGVAAGIATFVGTVLAIYYGRREGRRRKPLAYHATVSPIPLASSKSLDAYNLSLVYEPREGQRREIDDAYVHYLRFVNFGAEAVRRADIAPANPLRIEVEGAEVLDATVEAVRRDVCQIAIGDIAKTEDETTIPVTFDFLDYRDGCLVRLLTTARPKGVKLVGDIIGMPEGVKTTADLVGLNRIWGRVGTGLAVLLEVAALALTVFVYRWVIGDWVSVWLVVLPVIALLLPLIITIVVSETIWPKSEPTFPRELLPRGLPFYPGGGFVDGEFIEPGPGDTLVLHRVTTVRSRPKDEGGDSDVATADESGRK